MPTLFPENRTRNQPFSGDRLCLLFMGDILIQIGRYLLKKISQGQTYSTILFRDRLIQKKFFWDTLAAFFIQGHTLHPFSGDRLIQIGRYLLKKISQGQTYSPILFRDILIQKNFSGDTLAAFFYAGIHLSTFSLGTDFEYRVFSGTYFLKKISQGQTYNI